MEEADAILADFQIPLAYETADLAHALGRVVIGPVEADRPVPAFDRICMDGYAFRWKDFEEGRREFEVRGVARAGWPKASLGSAGECMEAMTGAVLPDGCDTVIPVERTERLDDHRVRFLVEDVPLGSNVHAIGRDRQAGDTVIETPARIGPVEIAALASVGITRPRVLLHPRILLVSSGDELVDPGRTPLAHQVRQSNVWAIAASLERAGFSRPEVRHVADDEGKLRTFLQGSLGRYDAIVLSGGVSMGKWDLLPSLLEELGVEKLVHGVAQQPGMPLWMGMDRKGGLVAGLPGNPLSALTCFARHVRPILLRSAAREPEGHPVLLLGGAKANPGKTRFLPVRLERQGAALAAHLVPVTGSGDWAGVVGTDGFVEIAPSTESVPAGSVVEFHPW